MERRQLLAASISLDWNIGGPPTIGLANPTVKVVGTDGDDEITLEPPPSGHYNDSATITVRDRATGTVLAQRYYPYWLIGKADVMALGGNDIVVNNLDRRAIVHGGAGGDSVYGGPRNDVLYGDEGHDWMVGQGGNDWLLGGAGNDSLGGGAGNDYVYGDAGHDLLGGGGGDDFLYGGTENDRISGGADDDVIHGDSGHDTLSGEDGLDWLYGDAGYDTLEGGFDGYSDVLFGGADPDIFVVGYDVTEYSMILRRVVDQYTEEEVVADAEPTDTLRRELRLIYV